MRVLGPALIVVGLVAVPAVAAPGDSQSHSSVAVVDRVSKLSVDLDQGSVTVRRGRTGSVDITKTWQGGQEPTVDVKVDKGVLSVTGHCPYLINGPLVYANSPLASCSTAVVVTLPAAGLAATVDTYGTVSLSDFAGSFDLHSGSGAVSVSRTTGPSLAVDTNGANVAVRDVAVGALSVSTGPGDVSVERAVVSGKATIDSNGGRLKVAALRARSLTATTGPGDQALSDVVLSSPLTLNSNGGAISVTELRASDLHVSSGPGDVRLRTVHTPTLGVDSNGGHVDVAGSDALKYDLSSGPGDVTLVTGTVPSSVKVDSNGGRVDVTVPRGAYGLVVSQNGGRLTIDGITLDARSGHSLDLAAGPGDITVLGR